MIIVNLMGGLGNQLFQYAAGRALSAHHQTKLKYVFADSYKLAKRDVRIDKFKINATALTEGEALDYFPKRKLQRRVYKFLGLQYDGRIFRETRYYSFEPEFFKIPANVYLYGFWQSYSYLKNIENRIREEIVIKEPSTAYLLAVKHIRSLNNSVSIHVRRGDYLNDKSGFSALPGSFYSSANEHILKKLGDYTPVIFSDDGEWVKENFNYFKNPVFASRFQLEDFEELMLMSSCKHNIIANSSFSWWGAWLNVNKEKLVIAPRHWHSLHTTNSQLIPQQWVQL